MKHLFFSIVFLFSFQVFSQITKENMVSNSMERSYTLKLPLNFDKSKNYDMVMVFHGALGTGDKLSKSSKFSELGDKNNFIAVYPNGMYKSWADARDVSKASKRGINDVMFITNLIKLIKGKYLINKVYTVGISNGGFMVQTLACKRPKMINAFASIISSLPKNIEHKCSKGHNVPMLLMNGTKDKYVPFKGGEMPMFTKGGKILSTPKTIDHWKKVNTTTLFPKIENLTNTDKTDGSKVVKHTYFKHNKPQVILYKVIGGGHGVPGGYAKRNPRRFKLGYVNQDIIAEEEIWNFLKLH